MHKRAALLVAPLWLALAAPLLCGHPIPDLPVRSFFAADGIVTIRVEIDPRCFAADPLNEPYLENARLRRLSPQERDKLVAQARQLATNSLEFWMLPAGRVVPEFAFRFTGFANKTLSTNAQEIASNALGCAEEPVMLTGEWKTDASGAAAYQVKARKAGKFAVRFLNEVDGKEQRPNVLFPGEESYQLDLTAWARAVNSR